MAFVVSEGQLVAVERPPTLPPVNVRFQDGAAETYDVIYRTQPQVRTVVGFLARNLAQLGLHTFRRVNDEDRVREREHPFARILARPNPYTSPYRWVEALVSDLGIFDVSCHLKIRPGRDQGGDGTLGSLVRVPPQMLQPLGSSWVTAEGVRIKGGRGHFDVPRDRLLLIHGYNPTDPRWGTSPLEALRTLLDEERSASLYRRATWRNGARISGYLKRPAGSTWSDGAFARFKEGWQRQYAGTGGHVGGTPILEDGMEFVPTSMTAEQAQYVEARKLTREEVAAAYWIPPTMLGLMDGATFSNVREQHKHLYQDTLGPLLTMLAQELNLQVRSEWDDAEDLYCEFNINEKLRGSFEEQASQLQTSVGAPWMTRNEARARHNLPAVAGGDDLVTPLNVLIGGQASPSDSAPPATGEAAAAPVRKGWRVLGKARADAGVVQQVTSVLVRFTERQRAALLSRVGAGITSVEDLWDAERWDSELAADLLRLNALIATSAGRATLAEIGVDEDTWDEDRTLPWLTVNAAAVAEGFNGRTRAEVADALDGDDDPGTSLGALFTGVVAARARQAAVRQVSAISGFGTAEAVNQLDLPALKTWRTTSGNPRSSHARLDGETVPVGDTFSNGARWPGDSNLRDDEAAGCRCRMDVSIPEPTSTDPAEEA